MSEQKKTLNQSVDKSSDTNLTRRKITKAALATPIVTSLSTTPVFGCSISGFLSGNTSGNHQYECGGNGCTPGFWKNHPDAWPVSPGTCSEYQGNTCSVWDYSTGTKIGQYLPTCADTILTSYGYTTDSTFMFILLKEISGGGATNSVLAHFIAAILNALSSPIYGSTVAEIQDGMCKAIEDGKVFEYKDILDALNSRGCFLNAHGNCEDGFIYLDDVGGCIPACNSGETYDFDKMLCVPK